MKQKLQSLENIICDIRPAIIGIQETHMKKIGQIKTPNSKEYQIYEHIRQNKNGGGIALAVIEELEPVWIKDGGDLAEAITIKVALGNTFNIRVTNAYGPQEYDSSDKKQFFLGVPR